MKARAIVALIMSTCAIAACTDEDEVTSVKPAPVGPRFSNVAAAPADLRVVDVAGEQLSLWPFTSQDLATTDKERDPINLIFRGQADPRSVRAALLQLDGDRTSFGMPNVFPFNCTWSDANGYMQATYTANVGWTGSVIQLQCGHFSPMRFHLRLFPAGKWTLANAHLDMHLPGSADHQVISWELAEQLVLADFMRSGLLAADPTVVIALNPAPFRTIPQLIYNGMPNGLKAMIGGPLGQVAGDVPILTDGNATVLTLNAAVTPVAETRTEKLTFDYDVRAPRPFCSNGPQDWVYLRGPVTLTTTVVQLQDGTLKARMRARGNLVVNTYDPVTGTIGAVSTSAFVNENHEVVFSTSGARIESTMLKKHAISSLGTGERQLIRLSIGAEATYTKDEVCL